MTLRAMGVSAYVLRKKSREIVLSSEGHLEGIGLGDKLQLIVAAPKGILVIRVDRKKNVDAVVELEADSKIVVPVDPNVPRYCQNITITEDPDGGLTTGYPSNNLRFMKYEGGGKFSLWVIAVVCQGDETFLTARKAETYGVWQNGRSPQCKDLEGWPQLQKVVWRKITTENIKLPRVEIPSSRINPEPPAEANIGIVKWYDVAYQKGCIVTSAGEARVTCRALPGEGYKSLTAGDKVEFVEVSPTAEEDSSSFKYRIQTILAVISKK